MLENFGEERIAAVDAAIVDALGEIKARVAELTRRERELKDALVAAADGAALAIEGETFRAAVSAPTTRTATDWKTVAERAGASRQLVAAHTRRVDVGPSVRVSARVRDAA